VAVKHGITDFTRTGFLYYKYVHKTVKTMFKERVIPVSKTKFFNYRPQGTRNCDFYFKKEHNSTEWE
jgi:hypothetical protein